MTTIEPGTRRSMAALGAMMLAAFTYLTAEIVPVGLLPDIAADLHVSLPAVGLLVTGYALTVAVASLPLTYLVRRVPRRYLLSALLGVFVLASCGSVIGPSYPVLMAGRVATALSQGVFWSIAAPTAAALFPARVRGRVTVTLFGGASLAPVLGVPAVTWLGQQAGWRVAFLAVGGIGLVALVGAATLVPTTPADSGHAATGATPDARRYWTLVAAIVLTITGVYTAYTYVTPFLTDVSGFSVDAVSPLLLVFGAAGVGGVAAAAVLIERFPRMAVLGPVALLAATLIALSAVGGSRAATVGLVAVWGFALPIVPSVFQTRVLEVAPGGTDLASAVYSSGFNVGIAGGALTGGILLSHTGLRGIYLVGGLLILVALAVLMAAPLAARIRAEPTS